MSDTKKKSLTPSWFRNVLGACEELAQQYASTKADLVVAQSRLSSMLSGSTMGKEAVLNARADALDESISIVLGPLVGTHQIPADRLKGVLSRIRKIKAGEKTADSVTSLIQHYKTQIAATATA